jgi:hypothetical protein
MILPLGIIRFMSDKFRGMLVNVRQFLAVPSLFIGLCFALLFQPVSAYRIHALVPFFFLWFTLAVRLAISSRRIIVLCLSAVLVTVYVISNAAGIWREQITYGGHNIPNALAVASFIGQDRARLGLQNGQMDVLSYRPDSYSNYSLFPYLYYLRDTAHYAIEFVPLGNDVNRARLDYPSTAYVYLLCTSPNRDWIRDGCDGHFESENPAYYVERQKQFPGETTLTVYKRVAVTLD